MPFSNGTYTGLANSFNDAQAETVIDPLDWNALFTDIETAINTIPGGIINVKTFGATGDGSTDDTSAFNSAIAATSTGKTLYIPAGTYCLTALTQITTPNITICGCGAGSILKFNTTGAGIDVNLAAGAGNQFAIKDLQFKTITNTAAALIRVTSCIDFLVERCFFLGASATWCIENITGYGFTIRDSTIAGCTGSGIVLRDNGAAPQYSYVASIYNCDFTQNSVTAIQVEKPAGLIIEDCVIEGCANGINVNSDASADAGGVILIGCWFEGNTNYDIQCPNGVATGLSATGCTFTDGGTRIVLGNGGIITLTQCGGASTVVSGSGNAQAILTMCSQITQTGTFPWTILNGDGIIAGSGVSSATGKIASEGSTLLFLTGGVFGSLKLDYNLINSNGWTFQGNVLIGASNLLGFGNGGCLTSPSDGAITVHDAAFNLSGTITTDGTNALSLSGVTGLGAASSSSTYVNLGAGTTSKSSLRFVQGSAPSSPVDGDVWREDNTNTGLKIRINGVTKTITVS